MQRVRMIGPQVMAPAYGPGGAPTPQGPDHEGGIEGMAHTRRVGIPGVVSLVVMALMACSVLMVMALATSTPADAQSTAGVTRIYVDGELVANTGDDHFTYTRELGPGCHDVRVVQGVGDSVRQVSQQQCSSGSTRLTVRVDDDSVSVSMTSISSSSSTTTAA